MKINPRITFDIKDWWVIKSRKGLRPTSYPITVRALLSTRLLHTASEIYCSNDGTQLYIEFLKNED